MAKLLLTTTKSNINRYKIRNTRLGLQCQTLLIPYPVSIPLVSYPLVLFLSRNLGEDSFSRCCCCCYQAKVKSTPSPCPKTWSLTKTFVPSLFHSSLFQVESNRNGQTKYFKAHQLHSQSKLFLRVKLKVISGDRYTRHHGHCSTWESNIRLVLP